MKKNKTFMQNKKNVTRKWHLVDVKGRILGRVATEIAQKLIGKNKVTYTPHVDSGDYVVVINASQVELSRNKADKKVYRWHTGFPGGLKERKFKDMLVQKPEFIIQRAVKNMLPKNKMRDRRMTRLKIFAGNDHPHQTHFKNE